jgi:hypothetical protein
VLLLEKVLNVHNKSLSCPPPQNSTILISFTLHGSGMCAHDCDQTSLPISHRSARHVRLMTVTRPHFLSVIFPHVTFASHNHLAFTSNLVSVPFHRPWCICFCIRQKNTPTPPPKIMSLPLLCRMPYITTKLTQLIVRNSNTCFTQNKSHRSLQQILHRILSLLSMYSVDRTRC